MERTSLLAELRQKLAGVAAQWDKLPEEDRKGPRVRQRFAELIMEANLTAREIQKLPSPGAVTGIYRAGKRAGDIWGSWSFRVDSHELCSIEDVATYSDAIAIAAQQLDCFWDEDCYLKVRLPDGWSPLLSRQWWQDFHGISLPDWIHVDHVSRDKADNRLCNLQLLPGWLNKAWRKGVSASHPQLARPSQEAVAGGARSTEKQQSSEETGSPSSLLKRRRQSY